jgi:hypothetical protein
MNDSRCLFPNGQQLDMLPNILRYTTSENVMPIGDSNPVEEAKRMK